MRSHDHDDALDIGIIEPSKDHYYQPAFTLVGGGVCSLKKTRRDESGLIPDGVKWIQDAAASIDPISKRVGLSRGGEVTYDFLVICPGLVMNGDAIEGFKGAVGSNGVCCNYSPDTVEYTWEVLKAFPRGGTALFAQPAMPIKCPGAPQHHQIVIVEDCLSDSRLLAPRRHIRRQPCAFSAAGAKHVLSALLRQGAEQSCG